MNLAFIAQDMEFSLNSDAFGGEGRVMGLMDQEDELERWGSVGKNP